MNGVLFPIMPWDLPGCYICKFRIVRFKNSIFNQDYFVQILTSKKENHQCFYFPKRKKSSKIISDNLQKLKFQKFDQVLQRKFYEICYPIIRKKLWLTSKMTSNLGKMPKTFIVKYLYTAGRPYNWICSKFDGNSIFDLRFYFNSNVDIKNLKPVVEFNHRHLRAGTMDNEKTNILCHSDVRSAVFENNKLNLKTILELMPNLDNCAFYNNLGEKWEKKLLEMSNKPKHLHLKPEKITDFRSLHKFLLIQKPNSSLTLNIRKISQFDQKKLDKFFVPWICGKYSPSLKISTLNFNRFYSLS